MFLASISSFTIYATKEKSILFKRGPQTHQNQGREVRFGNVSQDRMLLNVFQYTRRKE